MNEEQVDEYEYINVDKLAKSLAVVAWESETRLISERDLWEPVIVPGNKAPLQRQIKPVWASHYWGLVDAYRELVTSFRKPE